MCSRANMAIPVLVQNIANMPAGAFMVTQELAVKSSICMNANSQIC